MKERPILFSGPMVRALLTGTKTQTRRIVKPHPEDMDLFEVVNNGQVKYRRPAGHPMLDEARNAPGYSVRSVPAGLALRCPYGQPGDRLWVRETWCDPSREGYPIMYRADCINGEYHWGVDDDGRPITAPEVSFKWKPSIHMFRDFSRITLEVTGIRVERLQDISGQDAIAEGIERPLSPNEQTVNELAIWRYRTLWESINGPGSWEANPWVWVVEFRRVK